MATWDAKQVRQEAIKFISGAARHELELDAGNIILEDDADEIGTKNTDATDTGATNAAGADVKSADLKRTEAKDVKPQRQKLAKSVKLVREPSFSVFAFQVREYFVCKEPLRELWRTADRFLRQLNNDLIATKRDIKGVANKRMVERDYISKAEQHIISLVKSCILAKSVQA